MFFPSGLLVLAVIEMVLVYLVITKGRKFALWIFFSGGMILALLGLTIYFEITFPYKQVGLNIYLVFFFSVMLMLAGIIGILVKFFSKKFS